jgi:hypothetical protein
MWLAGTMPLSTNIGLPRDAADPKHDEKKGGAWGNKIKTCYGKKTKMLNNVVILVASYWILAFWQALCLCS